MRVTYPGPDPVTVLALDGRTVEAGDTVNVPAALGRQLIAQGWHGPGTPPAKGEPPAINTTDGADGA